MNRSSQLALLATDDDIADQGLLRFHLNEITNLKITFHAFVIPEKHVTFLKDQTLHFKLVDCIKASSTWLGRFRTIPRKANFSITDIMGSQIQSPYYGY